MPFLKRYIDPRQTLGSYFLSSTRRHDLFPDDTHCDQAPAAGSHQRVHDGGRPELHLSHSPYDTAPAADSHHGARANDEFEPHLLQASGESEPHLSHTHYELAPYLLHPRHDPIPTADSHRCEFLQCTVLVNHIWQEYMQLFYS